MVISQSPEAGIEKKKTIKKPQNKTTTFIHIQEGKERNTLLLYSNNY